jgi:hypothetical protein
MRNIDAPFNRRALAFLCAVAVTLITLSSSALAEDKLKAEDLIAKHLEAIGSPAARASERSRIVAGTSRAIFKVRSSSGAIDGRVVFGSVNRKALFAMAFTAPNYPGEKFGFDGKKLTVGYLTPGIRSALGNFLVANDELFKEGLMAGTLSSAWSLLDLTGRKAKVEYAGTDKIDGKPVHKLKYLPNKGSEVKVTLYFDATTFHHLRTQYDQVIATRLGAGGVDNQARQAETRYKMVENFSDYKKEGELTLPHSYTIQLEITKLNGSSLDKWEMNLEQFAFNQEIDEKSFDVEKN